MADSIFSLKDKITFSYATKGNDFVGCKVSNEKIKVTLPIGYKTLNLTDMNDEEIRLVIQKLVFAIVNEGKKREGEFHGHINTTIDQSYDVPVSACYFLIMDYLKNGYYTTSEPSFQQRTSGKIDWNKTIKTVKPSFTKEGDPVYLQYVVRKSQINDEEMITQIHKYCVWFAFNTFGFMLTSFNPEKPLLKYNKKLFVKIIKKALASTFSRHESELFHNMLALLEILDNDCNFHSVIIGTTNFEHVWEYMIDTAYGETETFKKEDFFPNSTWLIETDGNKIKKGRAGNLIPDTICLKKKEEEKYCYIFDAKYYGYSLEDIHSLPEMSSIAKQIHYGQYVYHKADDFGITDRTHNIFNAFLLPGNLSDLKNSVQPRYIGYARETWNKEKKSYDFIYSYILDTASLINDYSYSIKRINELTDSILKDRSRIEKVESEFNK